MNHGKTLVEKKATVGDCPSDVEIMIVEYLFNTLFGKFDFFSLLI